jgi:hypothetical protein
MTRTKIGGPKHQEPEPFGPPIVGLMQFKFVRKDIGEL